jgi:hypothetical protein
MAAFDIKIFWKDLSMLSCGTFVFLMKLLNGTLMFQCQEVEEVDDFT